jgi:cytochrome c oxidase cbb3-type subunit 3
MKKSSRYIVPLVLAIFTGALVLPGLKGESIASVISDPLTWIIGLLVIFLIFSIIAVSDALNSIKYHVLKKEGRLAELGIDEETDEETYIAGTSFLAKFWQKLQDSKPIEEESEIELDHSYDGIHELDNNLPPWWLWGFYISIAFAVIYLVRYHVIGSAPLQQAEYEQQMAEAEIQKAEYLKNAANLVDETTVVMLTEESPIQEGATIFAKNCAVCHAADGGGGVGPNLTDNYWLHGGDIKDVFATIKYGVPAKGMIPWKDQLSPVETQKVASFIMTLVGTTPANPKEAQGELTVQTTAVATDTVATTNSDTATTVEAATADTTNTTN